MRHYRLYFFDAGQHIARFESIEAAGDEDAIELAIGHAGQQRMELWQRARIVRTFNGRR